ncbi:hypothetical protein QBC47DRAFT_398529 [Echria macrotheca]|uniref:Uncharacterized protein n=1 Tax=Echria macrotheca TaxID=438768 RepID=A0AAJ0BK36_9PEZI|nr:hypothetical protein QBC47DRAFT_398529 [Echria macrotheca]
MPPPVPSGMPPPPPLLLTKRVTAFLRANLSDLIHDAVLTTPAGNLLVQASRLPASTLRRQCAVAASLWAYQSSAKNNTIPSSPNGGGSHGSSPATTETSSTADGHPRPGAAVTVQLDSGDIFVIRQLACGMLFICMGSDGQPAATGKGKSKALGQGQGNSIPGAPASQAEDQAAAAAADDNHSIGGSSTAAAPGISGNPPNNSAGLGVSAMSTTTTTQGSSQGGTTNQIGSFSEAESIHSTGGTTSTSQGSIAGTSSSIRTATPGHVVAMRRQVEELARALDKALGALHVPEVGITGHSSGHGLLDRH